MKALLAGDTTNVFPLLTSVRSDCFLGDIFIEVKQRVKSSCHFVTIRNSLTGFS